MAEFGWQRILVGMIVLIFTFTLYNTLMNPYFMLSIGVTGLMHSQVQTIMGVIKPIIVIGIITGVMFLVFGISPVTSFMVAILGLVMYFTFTNPMFMSILGMDVSQQVGAMNWLNYLQPVIISGIILAAAVVLIQVRGD